MLGGRWDDYDQHLTRLCEQVLVSLIGDIGPWSQRMVLVGGLAPRYIIGKLPTGAPAHVGTGDIDLVIRLVMTIIENPQGRSSKVPTLGLVVLG